MRLALSAKGAVELEWVKVSGRFDLAWLGEAARAEAIAHWFAEVPGDLRPGLFGRYSGPGGVGVAWQRPDAEVDFDWGRGSQGEGLEADRFDVERKGWLVVPEPHEVRVVSRAGDASLSLGTERGDPSAPLTLPRGLHAMEIAFRRQAGEASVRLEWRRLGGEWEIPDLRHLRRAIR